MIPDTTLTTYHKLKVMRLMNQHKQLEYRGSCTRSLTVMRPQSIIISNLYIHPPPRCCNSRNYQLSLARPRIDIFTTNIAFAGAFFVEQPTSDSQILSFTLFLQAKTSCTPWSSCTWWIVTKNCYGERLGGGGRMTDMFSTDCHCSESVSDCSPET